MKSFTSKWLKEMARVSSSYFLLSAFCLLIIVGINVPFIASHSEAASNKRAKSSEAARAIKAKPGLKSKGVKAGRKARPASPDKRLALSRNHKKPAINLKDQEKEIKRFDQPGEAADFYKKKRVPFGQKNIPVERYIAAREHIRKMPQYSTALNTPLPSQQYMEDHGAELDALGAWTSLGPGNIGGRTRALVINPADANIMYAGGVAGGVWKTTNGGGSWIPLNDLLPNLAVCSLALDPANPNIIYAGTGEGVFNGDFVRGAGIFKSTNGGSTWTHLTNTINSNFHFVNDLIVSPLNGQRVYAGTRTGVWQSTNGGTDWTRVLNPVIQGGCFDLAIRTDQPTDHVLASCGSVFTATGAQATIYRNTDAGGSGVWSPVQTESGMGRTTIAFAPSNQSIAYAVSAESNSSSTFHLGLHAVFRSTDGGGSWSARVRNSDPTKMNTVLLTNPVFAFFSECGFGTTQFFNQGWYDNALAVDPVDPNRVWVGGIDLFRSDDGGANWGIASYWWADRTDPQFVHADQHAIVFHPQYNGTSNKTLFIGNDGGIFRTTDARGGLVTSASGVCDPANGLITWSNLNNNYGATQFYHGVPYPDGNTYFGGTQDNGTVRGTTAGGATWSTILGGDGGYVAVDRANTSVVFGENTGLSIRRSIDGGASFSPATTGITDSGFLFTAPFIMDPSNSTRLFTGGSFIWRTLNSGTLWTRASTVLPNGSVSALAVANTNANNGLAGTDEGDIHRTNIALTSTSTTGWPAVRPRNGFVSWVTFSPTNASIAYATYASFNAVAGDMHVYKSTDAGATWTGIDGTGPTAIPDVPTHSIVVDPANGSRLYVGTDVGVFSSTDGGANWARENTGFANAVTESLFINTIGSTHTLFAFTHGRGAWKVQLPAGGGGTNADTTGVFRPSNGALFLKNSNTTGFADIVLTYGSPGDIPVSGDWDGDGDDTIGVYRNGNFLLRNSNTNGFADIVVTFGAAGDLPVVGDWNGDGIDTVGVYRNGTFFLRNSNTSGGPDITFDLGVAGDVPISGDWNGDGTETTGVFRPSNGALFLKNTNSTGFADIVLTYGLPGDKPVTGDWNGDGMDTIGVYRAGTFLLRNSNTNGFADIVFSLGVDGDVPISGDWDNMP